MPDPDRPVVRRAFARLEPELTAFAARHSLAVERYARGFPMWSFNFRHPKGGCASLQLSVNVHEGGELRGTLLPHWWVEVEDEDRRLAADFPTTRVLSLEGSVVMAALEQALAKVLETEETALTRVTWRRKSPGGERTELPLPT